MLQKDFFQVQPFNPNPYWDNTIVNLSGAQKFEQNTVFKPGRYKIELAPGKGAYNDSTLIPEAIAASGGLTLVPNMTYTENITQPFIIRAYCGSNATKTSIGTNLYSGSFKVNGITSNTTQHGIDVNHIFGAGGGNAYINASGAYWGKWYNRGGGNCLGNGNIITDTFTNTTSYGGAGSCLHLIPVGGTFGTDYIRAYHACCNVGIPGSAYGGAAGGKYVNSSAGDWGYRGGNSPYGNGGTAQQYTPVIFDGYECSAGSGVGAGGKTINYTNSGYTYQVVVGAGAYFNGTTWIDKPGNLSSTNSSYIRVTYLGPLN